MIKNILLFMVFAGGHVGCDKQTTTTRYATEKVTKGDLVFSASFHGELKPRKTESIYIPRLSDLWQVTIESVKPDGTKVKKGDEILRFDTAQLEDQLRTKTAELSVQKAELRQLEEALEKEKIDLELTVKRRELQVKKAELNVVEGVEFISKLELSKAKIDVSRAKLELKLARDALNAFKNKKEAALNVRTLKMASVKEKVDEYKSNLEKMVIYAPSDGVVYAPYTRIMWVMKKAAPGVVARPGDKLLELPDLSEFDAKVFIRQRDAALLKIGDIATVYATTHPERGIDGVIVEKDEFTTTRNDRLNTKTPQGNLKEVQVTVRLSTTLQGLRPGGTIRAHISTKLAENVVLAPLSGLAARDKVYVATTEAGEERIVKIGQTSSTHAEVLEGLRAGERIRLVAP